ncbi:Rpn family recombination-promoting nuclease/putative transposase [Sorangium sp. So ce1036]|uniref:Rpn family recombination-promoting nuclease/putative transposase n=1 Tax=Sorangium sp. So ce1036 TaxID=3133328 RepID=UPI003F10FD47
MTPTPHDALFKATFSQPEHAAAALRQVLPPALAARIQFGSLSLLPGSFIDEKLAASHSDLLFSASIESARREQASILLYLLFEHQSTTHPLMAFRLLEYMVRIWQSHLQRHPKATRLPAILPVVLHHSDTGWTAAVAFQDLIDLPPETLALMAEYVPRFRFVLDDISAETDDALRARAMTALGRLVLWCLRHARHPEDLVARLSAWTEVVREVRLAPGGGAALSRVWRYILNIADPARPRELLERLLLSAGPEAKEEIVTIADYLREQGRLAGEREGRLAGEREGRLAGEREGRLAGEREGQRSTLLKLLRLRFGELPAPVVARVRAADAARLERWTERVLSSPTLDDVLLER